MLWIGSSVVFAVLLFTTFHLTGECFCVILPTKYILCMFSPNHQLFAHRMSAAGWCTRMCARAPAPSPSGL